MSWDSWIESFKTLSYVQDAAICGYSGSRGRGHVAQGCVPSIWASFPNGPLSKISTDQLSILTCDHEREKLLTNGVVLGEQRFGMLRDNFLMLEEEGDSGISTIDLKTKPPAGCSKTYNMAVAATSRVIVLVLGNEGSLGPKVTIAAQEKATELKNSGF